LFSTFFGAFGLLSRDVYRLPLGTSLILAAVGGATLTLAAAAGFWRYFLAGTEHSELQRVPLLGTVGHVCLTIPARGVGSIAYTVQAKRTTMPARSRLDRELPKDTPVMIVGVDASIALVEEF